MSQLLRAFTLTCAFLSFPAQARQSLTPPAGKWVVNFADSRCTASRTYSRGNREVVLAVRPAPTLGRTFLIFQVPGADFGSPYTDVSYWIGESKRPVITGSWVTP